MDFQDLLQKYKIPIIGGLVGLILIGFGLLVLLSSNRDENSIQIIQEEVAPSERMTVDLQGAVMKPGVFELQNNSRINDLLIRAGGLSAEANRDWVAKNLNLAQKLKDGDKIYIPKVGDTGGMILSWKTEQAGVSGAISKINLNTASLEDLDSLWGIGEARAQKIIESRPYNSTEDLLNRKIIPQNVYEKIKDKVIAY